ncbi:hypothetical protein [Trujillonella endophytica]|uniref:DivIVA protein n=1 Tax=Trujillonella endophytica TaxID=673521 RepID=A0A1H8Q323_9ACTN|nr:hypothetical protein [Trujillella endophytica]SEO48398.1 hypothetical protein SAMN05660991_00533 [Trujillella endophytica]
MSVQLDDPARAVPAPGEEVRTERLRPNVAGDLPSVLGAGPMFGRAVAGYDRFQVDTYVQWAEGELTAAERELDSLMARHLSTRAALDEARQLLSHSAGGGELLSASRRIGDLLATAADEAEDIRAEARAEAAAAAARSQRLLARADETVLAAQTGATRLVADATATATAVTAEADRILVEAETTLSGAHRAAADLREEALRVEQRALARAGELHEAAVADAAAVLLRARAEAVAMLDTARAQRRRADDAAAAERAHLDRTAAERRAALLAELDRLDQQRAALTAEIGRLAEGAPSTPAPAPHPLRRVLGGLRHRSGALPVA